MKINVAAACVPDVKGDRDRNLSAAVSMIRQLSAAGAQIIVLPEACLQGYPIHGSDLSGAQRRAIATANASYSSARRHVWQRRRSGAP